MFCGIIKANPDDELGFPMLIDKNVSSYSLHCRVMPISLMIHRK